MRQLPPGRCRCRNLPVMPIPSKSKPQHCPRCKSRLACRMQRANAYPLALPQLPQSLELIGSRAIPDKSNVVNNHPDRIIPISLLPQFILGRELLLDTPGLSYRLPCRLLLPGDELRLQRALRRWSQDHTPQRQPPLSMSPATCQHCPSSGVYNACQCTIECP